MNIVLVGIGYDEDGSHVTDFVTLGTCPYWVPFLRDLDEKISSRFNWWNNNISYKLNSYLFSKINQLKRYAIEPSETLALSRVADLDKYLVWTVYPDFNFIKDSEEDGEVEFVLSISCTDSDVMFFKSLDEKLARLLPYYKSRSWAHQAWLFEQFLVVLELAIPEEDFEELEKWA